MTPFNPFDGMENWSYIGMMNAMFGLSAADAMGDGHPVIVLPGFCTGPQHTLVLRTVLTTKGYDTHDWGQGMNMGPSHDMNVALQATLIALNSRTGKKVSLIGWSLGGLYSRALANQFSERVDRVITLGSPHRADPTDSALRPLFEMLSPTPLSEVTDEERALVLRDPPLPVTSIYTKNDECVDWRDCLVDEGPLAENVEVHGSHMGLTHNPDVIRIILSRLDQA